MARVEIILDETDEFALNYIWGSIDIGAPDDEMLVQAKIAVAEILG